MGWELHRRQVLLGAAGVTLGAVMPGRVLADSATPVASPVAGGWTYTDFLGRVVSTPEFPTRIAAEIGTASTLYDMGIQVASVWGAPANDPEGYQEAWGRLPVDSVVNISTGTGEIDPEKAVREGTDLFILGSTELVNPDSYGGHDSYVDLIKPIAPIAAWPFLSRLDETMAAIWDLAIALGADPESDANVAARETYEGAIREVQAIVAAKPGLTTFFGYPTPTELYVANPDLWDDVNFFRYLGLGVVALSDDLQGEWWDVLSWELAMKYQTDTAFMASVAGALTLPELQEHPTFSQHPAMQANQVGVWSWYFARSPQGITTLLKNVLAVIRTAEKVTA